MLRLTFTLTEEDLPSERLDRLLHLRLGPEQFSRSRIERAIKDGAVHINDLPVTSPAIRPKLGDRVDFITPEARELNIVADATVPFKVVHQDEHIIVVDKPAGVVVHPGAGAQEGTLVSGLIHLLGDNLPELSGAFRPGIVHRLDKDTSGLMVVALTEDAWSNLQKQFQPPRTIHRTYLAVTLQKPRAGKCSVVNDNSGVISLPIGRDRNSRVKMSSRSSNAKEASTNWRIDQELRHGVVLSCSLETGRTHQIRVHLAECSAPIVGDSVYGAALKSYRPDIRQKMDVINRQALHAHKLSFLHPNGGDLIHFESELPHDILNLIAALDR